MVRLFYRNEAEQAKVFSCAVGDGVFLCVKFYGNCFIAEGEESVSRIRAFSEGAAVVAVAAGVGYLVWTYEAPEKNPCQDLRELFAESVPASHLRDALGANARIVVDDTLDAENGLPCGVRLEPVEY